MGWSGVGVVETTVKRRGMRLLRLRAIMCKLLFDDDRHATSSDEYEMR